jgi:acetyl esterase
MPSERTQARLARAFAALPPRVQVKLSRMPPITIDGQRLDPEVQLLLATRRLIGEPVWDEHLDVARARALAREEAAMAAGTRPVGVGSVTALEVAGLQARHYAPPEDTGPRPLLLFWHGGGFVVGDLDTHDAPCRMLCRHAGVHVLSVEYRLAPEHAFPAYLDDAHDSYTWARAHGRELGGDGRVVIGGDSAGGNLTAVIAQETRGGGGPDAQLLIYPAVDVSRRRRSYELFGEGFFLTDTLMTWYAGHFLGPGADPADPRRSPLLAPDLSGLAPALVVTAGFDPLRDEGEAYAAALAAAGVPLLARRFTGLFHTFIHAVGISPACRAAMAEVGGMLRALLSAPAAGPARGR